MANNNALVDAVWRKGKVVATHNPDVHRKDDFGAWMQYDQYGDRSAQYGWEIDHIVPVDKGGSDDLSNLRPLHWQNNASKGSTLLTR